jgi:hypothetical protein
MAYTTWFFDSKHFFPAKEMSIQAYTTLFFTTNAKNKKTIIGETRNKKINLKKIKILS